jgi:hypothetical protein
MKHPGYNSPQGVPPILWKISAAGKPPEVRVKTVLREILPSSAALIPMETTGQREMPELFPPREETCLRGEQTMNRRGPEFQEAAIPINLLW